MKKILIIGAKGMLGNDLIKIFKDQNLILWDKEEIDITNENLVNTKIVQLKPEIIINVAAYTDVDRCETNQDLAMKVNGYAIKYIAQVCKKIGAILIHISTDYVFHGDKKDGYKEDDIPQNPLNVYGKSKLLGEKLLLKIQPKFYLIRTSWLYGHYGKNFVDTILKIAKEKIEKKEKNIKVVNDQHGSPTYTLDLAKKIKEILELEKPFGIYHITNSENCTWYDFALEILKISNTKIKVEPCSTKDFPRPALRPEYSILLNTKLSQMRSWKEALKEYLL